MNDDLRSSQPAPTPRLRRRFRYALFAIIALIALLIFAAPSGCRSSQVNALQFFADLHGTPSPLVDSMTSGPGGPSAWGEGNLKPALPSLALGDVLVRYNAPGTRTEAHLFAVDPAELATQLRVAAVQERLNGDRGAAWDALQLRPSDATGVTLPFDVVVPYPNINVYPGSTSAEALLSPAMFAGPSPHFLSGPAATPDARGSVKAVRIYDHGACSHTIRLQPLLDSKAKAALRGLNAALASYGGLSIVDFMHASVYLDHDESATPQDVNDGLFIDAHFTATFPFPNPQPDIHVWLWAEGHFFMYQGILRFYMPVPLILPDHNPGVSYVEMETVRAQIEAQVLDIRSQIFQQGYDAQHVDFGTTLAGPCNPDDANPCKAVYPVIAERIGAGADAINGMSSLKGPLPDSDPNYLSDKDKSDLVDAVIGVKRLGTDAWSCTYNPDKDNSTCKYFVPAKRFNIYPDEAEVVFFDGKETSNPAYALWVATADKVLAFARPIMCNWEPTHATTETYPRTFAVFSQTGP